MFHRTYGLAFATVLGLALPAASAATITVSKGGAISTIQAGVDAASAGDTVVVKSGIYQENVLVDGLSGLKLRAVGKVTIEARAAAGVGGGPGIRVINSNGVRIEGFTIQNAADHPINGTFGRGVDATGDDHFVTKCTILECNGEGVIVTGNDARVVNCDLLYNVVGVEIVGAGARITSCDVFADDSQGFDVTGNGATISKCRISGIEDGLGIEVIGDGALIEKCDILNTDSDGILVAGNDARIRKNDIDGCDQGIDVDGAACLVQDNKISCCAAEGVEVDGADAEIDGNKISRCDDSGIDCDGLNPTITDNDISHILDDDEGMIVSGATLGGLVEGNTVAFAAEDGFEIQSSCSGLTIRKNVAKFCAFEEEAGFVIAGTDHLLEDNKSLKNGGDGFNINGNDHSLRRNSAIDNAQDGFDVDSGMANNVVLDDNVARGNLAEGIEINGTNAILTDNVAQKNRLDIASDGSIATFTGNVFTTGGQATAPEID